MQRLILVLCVWLWTLAGCVSSEPPILVFRGTPTPETIVSQQTPAIYGQSGAIVPAQNPAVPDFTTRVRIFNEYNTVAFDIWIDPVEFDAQGNPAGQPFRLFPLYDQNSNNPREHVFRLAPGPHRLYFKGFYQTDHHGTRPGPSGWYQFQVVNRDQPCYYCLEISTRWFR